MDIMNLMETKLYKVVFEGDRKSLEELTRDNLEILKGVTPQGNSALHVAAGRGHHEMVKLLIKKKPCILSMKNIKHETPLHKAAAAGHLQAVEFFLNINQQFECNCDAHERTDLEACDPILACDDVELIWRSVNWDGETALHYAARGGYVDVVEALLEKVKGMETAVNYSGESALYTACDHGRSEVAKKLLNEDLSVADTRGDNRTCLHVAIYTDQTVLALELLNKRSELASKADDSGNMPLHLAASHYSLQLVEKLLMIAPKTSFHLNKDKMAPIHIAARNADTAIIDSLIKETPHCIELLGPDNKNALHFALDQNFRYATLSLLRSNLDAAFLINEPDNEGNTAWHKTTREEVAREMVKISQWNLNAKNQKEETALSRNPPIPVPSIIRSRGAISGPAKKWEDRKDKASEMSEKTSSPEKKDLTETYSIIAALLATVTFAAGFTVPGGVSSEQGIPLRMRSAAFITFIISNTLALSTSMLAIVVLLDLPRLASWKWLEKFLASASPDLLPEMALRIGRYLVACAFTATMVSYVMGIYVLVAPKSLWLAIIVCLMGCSVPIIWVFYKFRFRRVALDVFRKTPL